MDKLPVFEMEIEQDPESQIGVSFVALVPNPAIERNFLAFNKNGEFVKPGESETKEDFIPRCMKAMVGEGKENDQAFAICNSLWENKGFNFNFAADNERRIISGPAMVANSLIYRKDESGEYNVFFSKKTVEEIALKFFKNDFQKNLNLFHDPNLSIEGVTIFESFITDKERGVQPMKGFEDLPDGTWFISAKVENEAIWEKIKSGEVKGFSVEGIFSYVKKPKSIEEQISELLNRTYNNTGLLKEKDAMSSVIKEMVDKFKKQLFEEIPPVVNASGETSAMYSLKDGTEVSIDKLESGGVALIAGVPAPVGEHELMDGTMITVGEGGVITEVKAPAQQSTDPVQKTPEQLIAAIKETVAGFEQLLAAQKAESEAKLSESAAAFESFKTEIAGQFNTQKTEFEKQISAAITIIEAQKKQIAGLFELVEKIAEQPTEAPVIENKTSFSSEKAAKKESRLNDLINTMAKIKQLKTA